MNIKALLITVLASLSFVLGYFITKLFKNKTKLGIFSIGFAFSILIGLSIFDLIPECIELFDKWYIMLIYVLVGIIILKLFDILLPHHEHTHEHSHIEHISFISFIAILLHNIIESIAIYTSSINDIKTGLFLSIGVMCHNIPLGIQLSSLSKKKGLLYVLLLVLSSVVGILVFFIFNIPFTDNILRIFMGITLGMLVYIILFELLCEIKENIKVKELIYGIVLGILIVLLSLFI